VARWAQVPTWHMQVIAETCPAEDRVPARRVFVGANGARFGLRWSGRAERPGSRSTPTRPATPAVLALARSGRACAGTRRPCRPRPPHVRRLLACHSYEEVKPKTLEKRVRVRSR
jgi:hypothetical protein